MIEDLEKHALENNVPIMQFDSVNYINNVIKSNNYKNVLEIGTAIGYLSICLALENSEVLITSIEKDNLRYLEAVENVNKFELQNRINLIFNDAMEVNLDDKFDLIIIDAAKSKNIEFFNKYKTLLNDNGTIIFDNMNFHGFVGNSSTIKSKNLRQMVKKIEKSIDYLKEQNEYEVKFYNIGDGLAVCQKAKI
jgi:predicted O-methyltransferase YrrM